MDLTKINQQNSPLLISIPFTSPQTNEYEAGESNQGEILQ